MDEVRGLKRLWRDVFGDGDEVIDTYFEYFYSPELAVFEKCGTAVAAACHIMPLGLLVLPGGEAEPCAALYAIAADPARRGEGFGARVTETAVRRAHDMGYSSVVLHPAQESLFGFYEKHGGFRTAFYAQERSICGNGAAVPARRVSPAEYNELRETQLKTRLHIRYDVRCMEFQKRLCALSGGGLFALPDGGCMIVESERGNVRVSELLGKTAREEALDEMSYTVRVPAAPAKTVPNVPHSRLYMS